MPYCCLYHCDTWTSRKKAWVGANHVIGSFRCLMYALRRNSFNPHNLTGAGGKITPPGRSFRCHFGTTCSRQILGGFSWICLDYEMAKSGHVHHHPEFQYGGRQTGNFKISKKIEIKDVVSPLADKISMKFQQRYLDSGSISPCEWIRILCDSTGSGKIQDGSHKTSNVCVSSLSDRATHKI